MDVLLSTQQISKQRRFSKDESYGNEAQVQGGAVLGVLNPSRLNGTLWFKRDSVITSEIKRTIRSDFPGSYRNYSTTPTNVKERWFNTIKRKFNWHPTIESEVKTMFHKCAVTKLIDMISRVKGRGKQPYWILDDQYKVLVDYWGIEKAKERSEKASKSRMSDRNGLGPHKHRAGARSYAKVADILREKNGDASYIDVLRETHKKSDGSFVDERAKLISEGFEKNVADYIFQDDIPATEDLTHEKKNEMYLKIVEATNGCVFGLGALLSENSINGRVSTTFETHVENEEALKQKLEEIYKENQEIKARLNRLDGLEKMLDLLCPRPSSSTGVNN